MVIYETRAGYEEAEARCQLAFKFERGNDCCGHVSDRRFYPKLAECPCEMGGIRFRNRFIPRIVCISSKGGFMTTYIIVVGVIALGIGFWAMT